MCVGVFNFWVGSLVCLAIIFFCLPRIRFFLLLLSFPRTSLRCVCRLPTFAKTYGIVLPFTPSGPKGDLSRTKHTPPPPSSPAVQPAVPSESADRGGEHGDGAQGGRVGLEDTRGKGPAFTVPKEEQVVVFANAADRGEGQSGSATANAIGESTTLPSFSSGKSETTPLNPSYLCSQLVGAALSEMGVLRGGGGDLGWLWVVPGAFGQGGAVDSRLADGVALGEEVRGDRRVRAMWMCVRVGRC